MQLCGSQDQIQYDLNSCEVDTEENAANQLDLPMEQYLHLYRTLPVQIIFNNYQ